jgi:hypothetical protein
MKTTRRTFLAAEREKDVKLRIFPPSARPWCNATYKLRRTSLPQMEMYPMKI